MLDSSSGDLNSAHGTARGICAVILTYNRKALLRECLQGILNQTRAADYILVVNNASTDGTAEMLNSEFPDIEVLAFSENVGSSAGFAAGMKWAYERGFERIWTTDDDGRPALDCLELLMKHADDRPMVLVPRQRDTKGHDYGFVQFKGKNIDVTEAVMQGRRHPVDRTFLFAFVGCLVPREAIAAVGVPDSRFFIAFDDSEFALRIQKHGAVGVRFVPEALFFHDLGLNRRRVKFLGISSLRSDLPVWKVYYNTRNTLYTLLWTRGHPKELVLFALVELRLMLMDVTYSQDRWARVRFRTKGFLDGLFRRLGPRVRPRGSAQTNISRVPAA